MLIQKHDDLRSLTFHQLEAIYKGAGLVGVDERFSDEVRQSAKNVEWLLAPQVIGK